MSGALAVRRVWRSVLGVFMLMLALGAVAQGQTPRPHHISLQRTTEALYLSGRIDLSPQQVVEETLLKSVPLYFVWQADVYRERWYWTDRRVASSTRTLRLAFQPLTRRWRVSLSNDSGVNAGGAGLQYALHQNYESLSDALTGVARVSRWKIADAARLPADESHRVEFNFRLDLSLLPRPFQIGLANQPEWTIDVRDQMSVPNRAEPERVSPASPTPGLEALELPASAASDAEAAVPVR